MEYNCLDVSKVYHRFGLKRQYIGIEDVNLSFKSGEIIGIVGLSSSGKSSLIDILSGKSKTSSGKLNYNGKEIARVYNETGIKLNKNLTVFDNMVNYGKKYKMNEIDVENRMSQLRDIFSLNKYINTKVGDLDKCNRIKCELAMVLLSSPRILFIDDAFVFLKNITKNEILKCLKRLSKLERTVVFLAATHLSDVDKIINRIIITDKNKIIYDDDVVKFKFSYCNKKIFEVFLNKNISITKIEGMEVLETGDYYYKILFDNTQGKFGEIINLFDVNNIVDLRVANQDLSDLIDIIKEDMKDD